LVAELPIRSERVQNSSFVKNHVAVLGKQAKRPAVL
jgi:hypothetical protein